MKRVKLHQMACGPKGRIDAGHIMTCTDAEAEHLVRSHQGTIVGAGPEIDPPAAAAPAESAESPEAELSDDTQPTGGRRRRG